MFTSLEVTSLTGGKQRSRSWLLGWKLMNRRFISQLMCRLPLLAIWTLVVIFILYRSLGGTDTQNHEDPAEIRSRLPDSNHQQIGLPFPKPSDTDQMVGQQRPIRRNYHVDSVSQAAFLAAKTKSSNVISGAPDELASLSIDSTTKRSIDRYSRLSRVFILLVQDENFHPLNSDKIRHQPHSIRASSYPAQLVQESIISNHRMTTPAHIRLLIDILKAHKIDYTIDNTQTGLPTSLLTDQSDVVGGKKQYSVIVIDDFLKYTKLSRWIRDQLDRHCRKNQIGVITYLTSIEQRSSQLFTHNNRPSRAVNHHSVTPSLATEESLADQFPLTLKSVDRKLCQNSSSFPSCLTDYQLNELSPILRILKRKQNFILRGPLEANLDRTPWISMSSNHITYEPLTWANLETDSIQNSIGLHKRGIVPVSTRKNDQSSQSDDHDPISLSSSHINVNEASLNLIQSQMLNQYNNTIQSDDQNHTSAFNSLELSNSEQENSPLSSNVGGDSQERLILSMFDKGLYDGIRRVIFGGANHHWLNRILLLEAIEHLSSGEILSPLERYVQIDIDDIFVGEKGKRMNASDVVALINTQDWLAQRISGGFKFNLGFSGKYFRRGLEAEIVGDERLISNAKEFTWFCHTWSHSKAHLAHSSQNIVEELKKNLKFAREHHLTLIGHEYNNSKDNSEAEQMSPTYAVAPHHSGVYPIHEPLYEAWRDVLNVQVTSTEEYPSLRPASGRRAFVHKTIQVLPRQTCGLYTHTIYRHRYPGGFGKLERNIRGGELFETVLHNPVNIYMTHMSNYANDRLAPYTFMELVKFVQSHTNLELKYASTTREQSGPSKLADYYFNLYPNQRQPLWTNPCNDKRHLAIWAPEKHQYCSVIPKLLIVGPQKTGTTALYSFLKINPLFKSSFMSPLDFEEVQFFNDKHYFQGVDWYLSRFVHLSSSKPEQEAASEVRHETNRPFGSNEEISGDASIYFDKSATYFDDPRVPERASHLLPEARIVILLVNPADRAYSWYQHIRAHGDRIANSVSFEQVITAKDEEATNGSSASSALINLRNRCLHPGYYSLHLTRWLEYYPSRQIIIIDGQWFRHNPASVMNRLQLILRVEQPLDYGKQLVYNEQKGFFCQRDAAGDREADTSRCLGSSKGRKYQPMSEEARSILNRHYLVHNKQLARILSDIGQPLPMWLDESLSSGRINPAAYWSN